MRKSNWVALLQEQFDHASSQEFSVGEFDCAIFAADCVKVMTDIDLMSIFKEYSTELGAAKQYQKLGGLVEALAETCKTHNLEEVAPAFATRGDIVFAYSEETQQEAIGIVDISGKYVKIADKTGLINIPFNMIKRAWRV